ncbi:OmpA family protein [Aeromicrobium sp.]|uniref:OmpA family protein n=1 Tax=Aeromicrobium sp. TaxID=1871063 RepID=UPI0030C2EE8D
MSEERLKGLAALMGLALVAIVIAGALVGSASVADDLRTRVDRALTAAGLGGIEVELSGREAVLSGGDAADLDRAELVVEGIEGVRSADVESTDAAAKPGAKKGSPTAPTLVLGRTTRGVAISGTVPDADAAAGLKAQAAEAFAVPVTGDLVIDPSVGSAGWLTRLPDVFGDIASIKGLDLQIDESGTMALTGRIESHAGAAKILQLVAAEVPDLEVRSRLTVEPGNLSEDDAALLNSSTLYFARGAARLSARNQRVLDVVAQILRSNRRLAIEAAGHTGPADPVKGERLGIARVAAVKAYLVAAGVRPGRIGTKVFGSVRTSTAGAFAQRYRRVDFVVTGD